mgnify:CR=1 FL=1
MRLQDNPSACLGTPHKLRGNARSTPLHRSAGCTRIIFYAPRSAKPATQSNPPTVLPSRPRNVRGVRRPGAVPQQRNYPCMCPLTLDDCTEAVAAPPKAALLHAVRKDSRTMPAHVHHNTSHITSRTGWCCVRLNVVACAVPSYALSLSVMLEQMLTRLRTACCATALLQCRYCIAQQPTFLT